MIRLIKNFLSFSSFERSAIVTLIIILFLITGIFIVMPYFILEKEVDFSDFEKEVERFEEYSKRADSIENEFSSKKYTNKIEMFYFDPNTATSSDWEKLGVKEYIIKTIQNYKNSGGKFYKKEDLEKIYGIDKEEFDRLKPYMRIKNQIKPYVSNEFGRRKNEFITKRELTAININVANQEELKKLKGIGEVYSSRIIKYRKLLGGFFEKEQLLEVYGFDTVTFNKIKGNIFVGNNNLTQISLNLADKKTLSKHPYIDYQLAKKIILFRDKNGAYKDVNDLLEKEIIIDKVLFLKLKPYLLLWE